MISDLLSSILNADFLYSVIRITAPILFAALGAVVAEKAGVTNIGLEGIMMISALFGVLLAIGRNPGYRCSRSSCSRRFVSPDDWFLCLQDENRHRYRRYCGKHVRRGRYHLPA